MTLSLVVIVLAVRLSYLFTLYVMGNGSVQRFHVESAALLLVVIGLIVRFFRADPDSAGPPQTPIQASVSRWAWLIYAAGALLLYWPVIRIGFLSDDFLLIDRARSWAIGPVTMELFRPLPLFVWATLLHLGSGPSIIHLLNVILHVANAYLTARLVSGWVEDRRWAFLAGLVMLTGPLAPEAVAWSSGVFDLVATFFVLTAIAIARTYTNDTPALTRCSLFGAAVLGLLSKETAAVLPALILVDAWMRRRFLPKLVRDVAALLAVDGIYGATRLAMRFGVTSPDLDFRFFRRGLFRSFGALAFPWHVDLLTISPWPFLCSALLLIWLVTLFVLRRGPVGAVRLALGCSIWIGVGIAPVFQDFFVSPDLQSARYLYLSSVGWSGLIVIMAADTQRHGPLMRVVGLGAALWWIMMAAYGTHQHVVPWIQAAELRDEVEKQVAEDPQMRRCGPVHLANLPDNARGAYVFRVGAREHFREKLDLDVIASNDGGPCSFKWDARARRFFPF